MVVVTGCGALLQEIEITKSGKLKGAKKAAKGAAAARAAAASKLRRSTSINTPGTSPGLAAPPALESFANNIESAGESSSPPSLTAAITEAKLASNSTSQTQVLMLSSLPLPHCMVLLRDWVMCITKQCCLGTLRRKLAWSEMNRR